MSDNEQTTQAELYRKLAAVMGELTRLPKTGENEFHGYKYATDADVADAIREKLAQQKVAFFASMIHHEQGPVAIPTSKGERLSIKTVADFEFTFADGETGATITLQWTGEALDNEDKGLSKSATSAEKYFLLKTFMLSTGSPKDDPDSGPHRTRARQVGDRDRTHDRQRLNGSDTPNRVDGLAADDDLTNREVAETFFVNTRAKGIADADVLAVLGVDKISQWTAGRRAAGERVLAWQAGKLSSDDSVTRHDQQRVFEGVQHLFDEPTNAGKWKHCANTYNKLVREGVIRAAMSNEQVIAKIAAYKAGAPVEDLAAVEDI